MAVKEESIPDAYAVEPLICISFIIIFRVPTSQQRIVVIGKLIERGIPRIDKSICDCALK